MDDLILIMIDDMIAQIQLLFIVYRMALEDKNYKKIFIIQYLLKIDKTIDKLIT